MKISRNLVFFAAVVLALLAGSAFAGVDERPSAAPHAAINQYQRSSQPYYLTADNAAMFASRRAPFQRSGLQSLTSAEMAALATTSLYQGANQPYYVTPDNAAMFASRHAPYQRSGIASLTAAERASALATTSRYSTFVHPYDGPHCGSGMLRTMVLAGCK